MRADYFMLPVVILLCAWILFISTYFAFIRGPFSPGWVQALSPLFLSLNLLVAIANLMVAETISWVGFQLCSVPSFLSFDQPPSAKDKSPHL